MRKTTALLAAFAILAGLTACTGTSTLVKDGSIAGCTPVAAPAGAASQAVTATGALKTAPKVSFPTPLRVTKTQTSVLVAGKGKAMTAGDSAFYDLTILNGRTGKVVAQGTYDSIGDGFSTIAKGAAFEAVTKGLECAQANSRIAIVANSQDGHQNKVYQGIRKTDSLVFVLDVTKTFPAQASGSSRLPKNGLPSVVTTKSGQPGIQIPAGTPPTSTKVTKELLKEGTGPKTKKDSFIVAKYTAVGWRDKTVFDSSWTIGEGQAKVIGLGNPGVVAGLRAGLIGQKVGSRVLLVVPPKLAVSDGSDQTLTVPTGTPLVYVVDILGIAQ